MLNKVRWKKQTSGLTQPVHEIQPELRLHHRKAPDGVTFDWARLERGWILAEPDDVKSLDKTRFTFKAHFIVHGFYTDHNSKWMLSMKDDLLALDNNCFVFLVGWGHNYGYGSRGVSYSRAVANLPLVGEWLGKVAKMLKDSLPHIYIHGIGHSLGAHLLGFAGRTSCAFDRITGLDPAGPRFGRQDYDGLETGDATDFVDVIHTDGKKLGFGTLDPIGTIDFYPNGGKHQPGRVSLTKSHARAYKLFGYSILHPGVFTTEVEILSESLASDPVHVHSRCPAEMGYHCRCERKPGGNYFIKTTAGPPWRDAGAS